MKFDPFSIDLPIVEVISQVRTNLEEGNALIVNAPPGAGKSTLLPLALLDAAWLDGKKILMLEPRRLAARTIAARMSSLIADEIGKTIGYRVRFDNRVSKNTKIEVVTEGILTRMIQSDNSLEDVGLVIFDEFHERSIHADVAMALCREAQQILRPDLRIMVMSATLDMPQLSNMLKCPVVISEGRQYPVDVQYSGQMDERMMSELTASMVIKAVKDHAGDVLVFLPGQGEIKKCEEILSKELRSFSIHPLYGQLPQHKQFAAILPHKDGKRKVVLATSIAETSLTIEGIKIVVDSGFGRVSKFDPKSGLTRLETVRISKDSADQRAGRAGRLAPGVCFRMWSAATHERLEDHRVPEILEADLASLVLEMAHWGIMDINQLSWLNNPPKGHVLQAKELLHEINALENAKITEHGKRIYEVPCHPRIAHMLVLAEDDEELALATDIAAILEERDPLPREAGIDINLRIEALRRHRKNESQGNKFNRIDKVASTYRKMFNIEPDNGSVDPFLTGVILSYAYPERIAHARPGNNAQFKLANGKLAMASHQDDLALEPWLAVAHIDARDGMGKIFMASPLNPRDLATLVKKQEVITWDTKKGGLIATEDLRIGSIVLQSKPIEEPDESHLIDAIVVAIQKEGEHLLSFDEEITQWQNRVLSLKKWNPTEEWPDVCTSTLLTSNSAWLRPYLENVKKPADLKKINLKEALHYHLDFEKQKALEKLAPSKIKVPSGSNINIHYYSNGEPPVLAVRLQEVFGLPETPRINNGQQPLLMHLLSPGFKPVQITSDLRSFWDHTYFEVRKEMKRRYPKHEWPDDPWNAAAIRGVKRR